MMDRQQKILEIEKLSQGAHGEGEVLIVEDYTDDQLAELRKTWKGLIINEHRNG